MRPDAARHDALVIVRDELACASSGLIVMRAESVRPDTGEAMIAGPLLQTPENSPESARQPSTIYIRSAVAITTWLFVWPVVYGFFLKSAAPANKLAHLIIVSGFTLWAFSFLGLYGILLALKEYSVALEILLNCLELVFEVLLSVLLS